MEAVTLNVSGKYFTIKKVLLKRFPKTKLGSLNENSPEYNPEKEEYFFDRNPKVIVSLLDLYRTGELHLPENVCSFTVKNELEFWGITEGLISECCWKKYFTSMRHKTVIDVIEKSLYSRPLVPDTPASWTDLVWVNMEFPQYSITSRIWFIIYMMFVITVVVIACLYTVPSLREPLPDVTEDPNQSGSILRMLMMTEMKGAIYVMDIVCLVFFTLELILKFSVCPKKGQFFTFGLNILDTVLAGVMWLSVIIDHIPDIEHVHLAHTILRATFCLNVLRIFHLGKSSAVMKLLMFTLRASVAAFGLLLVTLTMAVIIYATLAYFAEVATQSDSFGNIPEAIWWTIITMTTVGFGDLYPQSWAGYIIGSVCALSGILLIALPIAIIASNFDAFYSNMPAAEQRMRRHRHLDAKDVTQSNIDNVTGRQDHTQSLYSKSQPETIPPVVN